MNRLTKLFQIKYPIVQAGMVWCSGWELASAVSNKGGLGLIGAGSMYPEVLRTHIRKCKAATNFPFGVNVPLLYPDTDLLMNIIAEEGVKIVFTSAGNPSLWTPWLKDQGITVVHVVSTSMQATKSVDKGVDAVVCEGFEAGGHNGKDEITTMCLVPLVVDAVGDRVPVIAAGGIGDGRTVAAALALGADGVQIGSRFAITQESSAHLNFKTKVVESDESATILTLKKLVPVRLIKNEFYEKIKESEERCAPADELAVLLGRGRAKKGIFEGDLIEGELEIGQVSGQLNDIPLVSEVFDRILSDYNWVVEKLPLKL